MNALQRAQFSKELAEQFPAGLFVQLDGRNGWVVQGRYHGQAFNRVQVLHSFLKQRVEVSPRRLLVPAAVEVRP